MKHIALRSKSLLGNYDYTVPGLGDKIHTLLIAHNYSVKHDTPVKLHMTESQCYAKIDVYRKIRAWNELLELFPTDISYEPHRVQPANEERWKEYLGGIDFYYYSDTMHMHPRDKVAPIDASKYLQFPQLPGVPVDIDLPDKFITTQWDSTDSGRRFDQKTIDKILGPYREQEYEVLTVGGAATDPKLKQIKYCGYAMSKASYHVGLDSGFFHMAWMYLKPNNIYLHIRKMNHHIFRGEKMGVNVMRA